jgi:hypothetical protein
MGVANHQHDRVFIMVLDFKAGCILATCLVCGQMWFPKREESGALRPGSLKCPNNRERRIL